MAKPHGDLGYFRSAKQALRKLHRAGICHNDLAKEQNWLRGTRRARLCHRFPARGLLQAARPAVPHRGLRGPAALLKHKRSYAPEALTPTERKILARKSVVASVWLVTGKKVYQRDHPRPVQFHRPRGRRPAAGQRRAGAGRDDPQKSGRARHRHRRLCRPPHRRRALCVRRGGQDRAGRTTAQRALLRQGRQSRRSISRSSTRCRATPPASRAPRSCNSSR